MAERARTALGPVMKHIQHQGGSGREGVLDAPLKPAGAVSLVLRGQSGMFSSPSPP